MDQKNKTTQNKSLKRVRIDQVSKGYTRTRIISKNKKSKLRIMHRANKDSSQMTVHSLSQSQTIIHESNNIHRLLPSNPIIHQDQFSTLYGPRPVLKYENVQYEGSSWNQVQNIQSTSQQSIMIKQEPESDNESDINNDDAEEYGQYEQFDEQVVQNYSGEIEENVQYEGSSWNQVQNIQSTSQQSIMIKQEPESDNESDINNDGAEEYGQYEQFDEQVAQNYSGEIEENVQYEDSPWNHVQNTQTTSQQTINIKQEPESDNEPDINPRSTQESYHYGRFIEDKLLAFSQKTREAVQLEFFKIICKAHQGYYE